MKPTVEWMKEKYIQFNNQIFNNYLEMPILKAEPISKRVLGCFSFEPQIEVRAKKSDMHMYYYDDFEGKYKYISHDNFLQIMNPSITLNTIWDCEEINLENTLIHEMCHYRTYIDGFCPKKVHGQEFTYWGAVVNLKSDGKYKITTYCDTYSEGSKLDDATALKYSKNLCGIYVRFINGDAENRFYLIKKDITNKFIELFNQIFKFWANEMTICSDPNWAKEMVASTNMTKTQRTVWNYYIASSDRVKKAIELMNNYPTEKKIFQPQNQSTIKENNMFSDIINEVFNELAEENNVIDILPGKNLSLETPFE